MYSECTKHTNKNPHASKDTGQSPHDEGIQQEITEALCGNLLSHGSLSHRGLGNRDGDVLALRSGLRGDVLVLGLEDGDDIRQRRLGTSLAQRVVRKHNLDLDTEHACGSANNKSGCSHGARYVARHEDTQKLPSTKSLLLTVVVERRT